MAKLKKPPVPKKVAEPVQAADAYYVELQVGYQVSIAPECEEWYPTWSGRIGIVEAIEAPETVTGAPMVDVQFPRTAHQEPAYAEVRANELVKVDVVAPAEMSVIKTEIEFLLVPLDSIEVTTNPRKTFDEVSLRELADSILAEGLIHPVLLRPRETAAGDVPRYDLVVGGRRYRAHQLAGLTHIPATVRRITDREFLEIQLTENHHRDDVNPAEEAEDFARAISFGLTVEEVALRLGMTPQFVAQRAQLAQLVPEFMEQLRTGRLHVGAAMLLARHEQDVQARIVPSLSTHYSDHITVAHVRQWVQKYLRELERAPFSLEDPTLNPAMGACVTCPFRTSVQMLLFPDLATSDCCLKGECYEVKVAAHIDRAAIGVEQELGKKPVLVSNTHYPDNKNLVSRSDFREVDANTPGAVPAVFVDGREGEVVYVKLTGKAATAANPAEQRAADLQATMLKNNIQRRHNWLTVEALVGEIRTKGPWREMLEVLVRRTLGAYGGPSRDQRAWLTEQFNFAPQADNFGGDQSIRNYLTAGMAKQTDQELMALLLVWDFAKSAHFEYPTYADDLAKAGNRIDLEAIRRLAEKQAAVPRKGKKPAATPEQLGEAISGVMGKEVANG